MVADIDLDKIVRKEWIFGGYKYYGIDVNYLSNFVLQPNTSQKKNIANASWLASFCRRLFDSYGTDGEYVNSRSITSDQSHDAMRILMTLCRKLKVDFKPEFRDFDSFRSYWSNHDGVNDWSARRVMVGEAFDPLISKLDDLQIDIDVSLDTLVVPISPAGKLGWDNVDREIEHLREDFAEAKSTMDYSNIGNDAIAVLEQLSAVVYSIADTEGLITEDDRKSLGKGETKNRLRFFAEKKIPEDNEDLQQLCRGAIGFAHDNKHNRTTDRKKAGIAADTAILVANILRRLDD